MAKGDDQLHCEANWPSDAEGMQEHRQKDLSPMAGILHQEELKTRCRDNRLL